MKIRGTVHDFFTSEVFIEEILARHYEFIYSYLTSQVIQFWFIIIINQVTMTKSLVYVYVYVVCLFPWVY